MITKFKIFEYNDLTGFEIGDRVEYFDVEENLWHKGFVVRTEEGNDMALVKFDDRWCDALHDGDGDDGDSLSYWCGFDNLRLDVKRERIFTTEDPYGEEEWEVNENAASIINDPYYKICLTNARKCKSDSERYGAVLVKNGKILGQGYNRGIAHAKFKLDRILKQGYANHAEVEAMNDALAKGYDIDGADIYVAGYFPKTGTLFFKTQFTCKLCIPYFKKFNIQHIFVPLPDRWNPRTIDECVEDSQLFKKGQIHQDRLKYLIGDYKIDLLNEWKTFGTKKIKSSLHVIKMLLYLEKFFRKGELINHHRLKKYTALLLFYEFLNRDDIKDKITLAEEYSGDANKIDDINDIVDYIASEYEKYRPGHEFFNDLYVETEYAWSFAINITDRDEKKLRHLKNLLPLGKRITPEDPYGEEIWENVEYDNLIKRIQSVLTKDLLKGMWNKEFANPLAGHCYAATEALYWMLGGPASDWKTYVLSHLSWPEGLDEGETHWFMRNSKGEILDPTAGQFEGQDIAYDKGRYNSMMNHPKGGSKRAREIMRRIGFLNENLINEKFFLPSRDNFIYYTQTGVDTNKVNRIMEIITPEWIKNNPVAFEVYKGKLYLTEGHHRFEACLRLNDKELLKTLFDSAVYYNVTWQPRKFKKKIIPQDIMLKESANITPQKVKAAVGLIKQTIKGTEWEGKVYIAGGAVRDELMGNDPKDVDLLINVPDGGILFAEWITKQLGIHTKGNPVIYPRFGTAKFSLRRQKFNGEDLSDIDIECVMPRKETYYEGDRKPDVSQGTLKDDVDRRDFTVNSLLKDLTTGEILDLTGMGKDDIKKGIVRTPLDPDVIFTDDPLRMLRAIRFATKYGWTLPLFMIRSLKKNAKKLQNISSERIREELDKMLLTKTPDKAIRLLQILGLSKYIFPELDKLIKMKQNKFHKYDAMRHSLEVLKNTPPDLVTRLSALLHDVGKAKAREVIDNEVHFYRHEELGAFMARDIMKRLKYPSDIIDAVATAVEHHMRTKQTGDEGIITDRALRKMKQDLGPHLQHTLDVIHADNISHADSANMPNQVSNIRKRFAQLEEKDKNAPKKSPLSGDDVMEILGIKKGPIVGKILKVLGDMYLDDPYMTKEELTEVVKKSYEEFK